MFVILSYDINRKRLAKVSKICCKYLRRKHKSVFEGTITDAKLEKLKRELEKVIDTRQDAICIYRLNSTRFMRKEEIGVSEEQSAII